MMATQPVFASLGGFGLGLGLLVAGAALLIALVVLRRRNRSFVDRLDRLSAILEAAAETAPVPFGSTTAAVDRHPIDEHLIAPREPDVTAPDVDAAFLRLDRALRQQREVIDAERRAVARMDRAVRAIPDGLVVVDEQGDIVFRNDVADEFAGGRHGDALIEAAVRQLVYEAVEQGQAGTRTLELFGPPRRTMVISARPLLSAGRAMGALAVIDDITERRRLEAVRRDFVANISHELKTPVGALSLLAETLVDEDDPQISRRLAERMINEATRLANTIEDLLVLSRIESEEAPEREAVPVHLVVAEAVNRIRPAADNAGIAIEAAEADHRLAVMGDRRQLVSALYNLLDNAVKYSGEESEVRIGVVNDGRQLAISVTDEGIGIPARDLDRIFERFYRVDVARSRQTGGTGLGLSIVRHVVANHEGEVSVDSRLGEGSTFTLRLPLTATGPVAIDAARAAVRHDERDAG
jgi:two-component system sensor histidine kinase SenX3